MTELGTRADPNRKGGTLRSLVRWLVPIAVLAGFALSGHVGEAIRALGQVEIQWALPLIAIGVGLPVSHAWRWCSLLERTGERIERSVSMRITALASLLNYSAPGFVGAPAKAILARDARSIPVSRSLPTLIVEQMLDALLLVIGGGVALILAGPAVISALGGTVSGNDLVIAAAFLGLVALILAVAGIAVRSLMPGFFDAIRSGTGELMSSDQHRLPILVLTGTRWLLDMAAIGLASIAVGLRLSVVEILLIGNLALLIGMVAPVPGGLGVREATMAAVAGVLGVSIPAILALSVLHRAGLSIGLPLTLGLSRLLEWRGR